MLEYILSPEAYPDDSRLFLAAGIARAWKRKSGFDVVRHIMHYTTI